MKKKLFLFQFIVASILISSYKSKQSKYTSLKYLHVCTELYSYKDKENKAAADTGYLWPHIVGKPLILNIKFLNGSKFQQKEVIKYAKMWSDVTSNKIQFLYKGYDFNDDNKYCNIRITFNDSGSNSWVGTEANEIDKDSATMNFGWINYTTSEIEIQEVVLHEFGHALGLVHEHQRPDAKIQWNESAVYAYYCDTLTHKWDSIAVQNNIFYRYDSTTLNATAYDSLSIMHYGIDSLLTIGGYWTPWNDNLSQLDIELINRLYP